MPSNRAARAWPSRGRSDGRRERTGNGCGAAIFRRRRSSAQKIHGVNHRLCIAKQNSRTAAILRCRFGPPLRFRVLVRSARRQVIATKAAMGAADPAKDIFP
jgi:hypothetical protein